MAVITLPHKFKARPYQREAFEAFDKGYKRMVMIWHRRAGKDKTALQMLIKGALQKKGVYYYVFPEYEQGRKIFWDGIDNDGLRNLDHIPKEVVARMNEQQMKIELVNGSIIQVVGTDKKIDNIVGTNPLGCVFSEYPISNPRGWDLLRPILKLNGGWAIFAFTPRGKNHGWKMRQVALANPETWFLSEKKAFETTDVSGNSIIAPQMIEEERREGMDEDLIQQEYFVSFDASIKGAYYADQLRQAREERRISSVPYEPGLDTYTFWDLGRNDTTDIWFVQFYGKEIRLIDIYEQSGEDLEHYVDVLKKKPYRYKAHYLPHDVEVTDLSAKVSRKQTLEGYGLENIKVVPRLSVEEGISAVRSCFKNCWFDEVKTEIGLNALGSYHKEWDDKNKTFRNSPKHDWSSNASDAFRYMAVTYKDISKPAESFVIETDYTNYW